LGTGSRGMQPIDSLREGVVKKPVLGAVIAVWLSLAGAAAAQDVADVTAYQALREEVAIAGILAGLGAGERPEIILFRNVRVVDPAAGTVTPHQSVALYRGRFNWIGDTGALPPLPPGTVVHEGGGAYMIPGLTDMHTHSHSLSAWLLDLAHGVTATRDMDGAPWLVATRDAIDRGAMPGPSLYLAGSIINMDAMDGFAVVPRDALGARRLVRQQAVCGYDFIKVHNALPQPIFDAVADEARRLGMDLVGHVPHGISVRHAAGAGMRTVEHLKGFLDDATLSAGDTDFAAGAGPEVWQTPTLNAWRGYDPKDSLAGFLATPAAGLVPARTREAWQAWLAAAEDDSYRRSVAARPIMAGIMAGLIGVQARFLAGTDGDYYPFQVMGWGLIDEVQRLDAAGLGPAGALDAATAQPAAAMRAGDDFGRIARGMRGDFVLLEGNPLESSAALHGRQGVMLHGLWLDRATLDGALDALRGVYASGVAGIDAGGADATAARAREMAARGYVFPPEILSAAAAAFHHRGLDDAARILDVLAAPAADPVCRSASR
jgi:imidazolonepropionase-like amidohydrolase